MGSTVTVTVAVWLSKVAEIRASPGAMPVTLPSLSAVATSVAPELHVAPMSQASVSSLYRAQAVSDTVSSTCSRRGPRIVRPVTVTGASGLDSTSTVSATLWRSKTAEIRASPGETPVRLPSLSTVATSGAEELHVAATPHVSVSLL